MARKSVSDDSYLSNFEETKDAAQRKSWTFYEAVKHNCNSGNIIMTESYEQKAAEESKSPETIKPETIKPGVLEAMDYVYRSKRDIQISIEQPEYTSVCPMTGLPDMGCITIEYVPAKTIVELKSLKYYLLQYRNVGIFYENIVNRILDDLVSVLSPKRMTVIGDFTPRGGISTVVTASYGEGD
jgi:7-cyano-7-deazaguanine reductase